MVLCDQRAQQGSINNLRLKIKNNKTIEAPQNIRYSYKLLHCFYENKNIEALKSLNFKNNLGLVQAQATSRLRIFYIRVLMLFLV